MPNSLLELYDADGTLNSIDVMGGLEGKGSLEIQHYLIAAAEFVAEKTGIPQVEILEGLKVSMLHILPRRTESPYWGTFPSSDGTRLPICPAVDHFLLTPHALTHYLRGRLQEEGSESTLGKIIGEFLASSWQYPLFQRGSSQSLPYATIEDDAVTALESRLSRDALMTVFTNSSAEKAVTLLQKAGFGSRIKRDGVERGKIGAIGNALKFQVDVSLPFDAGNRLDLSAHGLSVPVDLRRTAYRNKVFQLMTESGAERVFMATDIPELDSYPLASWYGDTAIHGMKTNPVSAPESIVAAREVLGARISDRLSELVVDL